MVGLELRKTRYKEFGKHKGRWFINFKRESICMMLKLVFYIIKYLDDVM